MIEKKIHPDLNTPTRGAHYMLSQGFKILPLAHNSKIPKYKSWQESSKTNDAGTIDSMYDGENFAVHPGLSGHVVIDIDVKAGKNGMESWVALQREHGDAPETFSVRTPSGGLHLYFKGQVVGQNTVIAKDVDTRSMNGYVVAPGSQIGDGIYEVVDFSVPVADAPEWLINLIVPKAATVMDRPAIAVVDAPVEIQRAIKYLEDAPICVSGEGGVGINLYQIFCTMHDYGITQDTARELVLEHYNHRCDPPWDMGSEDDVAHFEQKLNNAYNYAQNSLGAKTVEATTRAAVEEFQAAPPLATPPVPAGAGAPLRGVTGDSIVDADIKICEWVAQGHLATGFVTVLTAPPGTGKSSFGMLMAVAVVTGLELLGPRCPVRKRGPVVVYNAEDPLDKMQRDFAALRLHLGLRASDTKGVVLISGVDEKLCVAKKGRSRNAEINRAVIERVIESVEHYGAVAAIFDPLIETHSVEENSNEDMSVVMGAFREIASRCPCAVQVVHHTSKAALHTDRADTSSQGLSRGASSIMGSARLAHNLTTMSAKDAATLGIAEAERRAYYKCEMTKNNLGPWAKQVEWYKISGIEIANGQSVGYSGWNAISDKGVVQDAGRHALTRESLLQVLRRELKFGESKPLSGMADSLALACGLKPDKPAKLVAGVREVLGDAKEFSFHQDADRQPWRVARADLDFL